MARVRKSSVVLRLALYGCPNRPFFHIVAGKRRAARNRYIYEQLGVYDPMPNEHNEKVISLNVDRIKYWLAHGAEPKKSVAVLLGLAGILPIHPYSIEVARRTHKNTSEHNDTQGIVMKQDAKKRVNMFKEKVCIYLNNYVGKGTISKDRRPLILKQCA